MDLWTKVGDQEKTDSKLKYMLERSGLNDQSDIWSVGWQSDLNLGD